MKTFKAWLRDQKHRDDPIGDVARDIFLDPDPSKDTAAIRAHLEDCGASPTVLDIYDEAVNEWLESER